MVMSFSNALSLLIILSACSISNVASQTPPAQHVANSLRPVHHQLEDDIRNDHHQNKFYVLGNSGHHTYDGKPGYSLFKIGSRNSIVPPPQANGQHPFVGPPQYSFLDSLFYGTLDRNRKPPDPAVKYCDPSKQGDISALGTFPTTEIDPYVLSTYEGATKHIENLSCKTSAYANFFSDPLWPKQWYMHDYRTSYGPVMDHNAIPVYEMGFTGYGVLISVVDSGIIKHPDLNRNYLTDVSYDYERMSMDAEPTEFNKDYIHGTQVASLIAMEPNNNLCGVGMAFNAKFASVKPSSKDSMLPLREAQALVHGLNLFKIIHNSRGPPDNGETMEHLNYVVHLALEKGIKLGRNGLGIIYPFPSGNGKHKNDHCSADGVVNHPFTIAISAVSQYGKSPYYSETCSAVFAAAYSGGERDDERLVTADFDGTCAKRFSGTSASLPFATSIFALMLEANPNLSIRDVMHIITMGAEVAPVADNPDTWYKNGAGFWVSNAFGFGLLNAENMVNLALQWEGVPPESHCKASALTSTLDQRLTVSSPISVKIEADCTKGVNWIEQVEVLASVAYPFRGALAIDLKSPAGTSTRIMDKRIKDSYSGGLKMWSMKSTHNWGEHPTGMWSILIIANRIAGIPAGNGYVVKLDLFIHGMKNPPPHQHLLPRKYSPFRTIYGQTSD